MPVSTTCVLMTMWLSSTFSQPMFSVTLPEWVYLTAFVSRFSVHCFIRVSSPRKRQGMLESALTTKASPFACARGEMMFTRSDITSPSS